ncbi:MAG TPA: hypothetical protein VJ912_01715 [Candidatus Nanoarchaeia archaeon]|nr:hypothetical protein [Candidatus Nanoarchaeia archaeon]
MRITKADGTIEHKCNIYRGKIKDVSLRNKKIYCRACYKPLSEDEVDPKMLKKIKEKWQNGKQRDNKKYGKDKSNNR